MKIIRDPSNPRQVKEVVDQIVRQFDNTGSAVLAANSTKTIIQNPKVTSMSKILLSPRDANAAQRMNATWVDQVSNGSFTVNHDSITAARKIDYVIFCIG